MTFLEDILVSLAEYRAGWWITAGWMILHLMLSPLAFANKWFLFGSAAFFACSAGFYSMHDMEITNRGAACTYGAVCIAYAVFIIFGAMSIRRKVYIRSRDLCTLLDVVDKHKEDLPPGFMRRFRDIHGIPPDT